ncbi:hypothetical protein [Kitasatospora sp. NPDC094015]|uniref:LmeA family phospholipid-binding protein n=1 Tax=Kitasatospora sp. NPDC094015 TaxID=3155205 RepID=UPI00333289A4
MTAALLRRAPGRRTGPRRTGPRRRRAVLAAAVAGLLLVAACGIGELTARRVLRGRVLAAAPALGDGATVGTGGGPVLWDVVRRRIPHLDIGSDRARFGRLAGLSVRARLDDVRLGAVTGVGGIRAEVTVPLASIGAAVQAAVPSLPVGQVTADPGSGVIEVPLGRGGLGTVTLRPELTAGKVTLPVVSTTVLGRPVSPEALGGLGGAGGGTGGGVGGAAGFGEESAKAERLGLTATALRLDPDALRITLTGGPTTLPGH